MEDRFNDHAKEDVKECFQMLNFGEEEASEEDITLSIHAIEGKQGVQTVRVFGNYQNRKLLMLVDSGSTTSFIDAKVARELKLPLVAVPPLRVSVADGRKMESTFTCPHFVWKGQQHQFSFDLRVLELGGYDIILGVDCI